MRSVFDDGKASGVYGFECSHSEVTVVSSRCSVLGGRRAKRLSGEGPAKSFLVGLRAHHGGGKEVRA